MKKGHTSETRRKIQASVKKTLAAKAAAIALAASAAQAGGLSDPIVQPPVGDPVSFDRTGSLYVKGGIGAALIEPNYTSNDVYLDYHWFKKNMPSDLTDFATDLGGTSPSATFEIGYLHPVGDFVFGAALDYTLFNAEASSECHTDALAQFNPRWVRPPHECAATLNDAASLSILAGYNSGPWQFLAGVGVAQGTGSQGWAGDIEGRGWDFDVQESIDLEGTTATLEVKYALTDASQIGLEVQAYDFDSVSTDHPWGDTTTNFDLVNTSITYSYRF